MQQDYMQSQKEISSVGWDQQLYWQEEDANITENKKDNEGINNGTSKEYMMAR
jgi:hypothetical protein